MTTARIIMKTAMKNIGVGAQSEDIDTDEMADVLIVFKSMVSSLSIEGLFIPHIQHASIDLTGASTFAVGDSQAINLTRPVDIVSVQYSDGPSVFDLIKIGARDWEQESIEVGIPTKFYYNDLYPIAQLNFNKTIQTATGGGGFDEAFSQHFRLGYHSYLDAPVLDADIDFPAEYDLFLINSLSVLIAPMFEADVTDRSLQILAQSAQSLKASIKRNNSETQEVDLDCAVLGDRRISRTNINGTYY